MQIIRGVIASLFFLLSLVVPLLVNAADQDNLALMAAAAAGQTEIVRELLDRDADVNHGTAEGITVLMQAAEGGHVETVQVL
ncbi:MAG: ankyrin repeat domain-containing protein, partial [Acidobacteriota bacterium]